jgi:hypothetical protein
MFRREFPEIVNLAGVVGAELSEVGHLVAGNFFLERSRIGLSDPACGGLEAQQELGEDTRGTTTPP